MHFAADMNDARKLRRDAVADRIATGARPLPPSFYTALE